VWVSRLGENTSTWNVRSVCFSRRAGAFSDKRLVHLSPLGWEHINLTGDYIWHANRRVVKGHFVHLGSHGRLLFAGLKLCAPVTWIKIKRGAFLFRQ
jgi:Tn3 transposase DDE domain